MSDTKHKNRKIIIYAWLLFTCLLVGSIWLELSLNVYHHFEFKGWHTGIYAVFGFVACVAIIFVSKFLAIFLKRKENYYDREGD